jgi:NhaP-type Na+/H+ or K+/H+ antiporter
MITILGTLSLVLFGIMMRMGSIKLSNRELFEKIKTQGFSSPLSAFFTLLAFVLLTSAILTAYQLAGMITSLKMTQCRMDVLN